MDNILTDALFDIDTLKDKGSMFPAHSCHWTVVASAVLARLEHPFQKILVVSNDFHSTVMVGEEGQYFDPLVHQADCKDLMARDDNWYILDITSIAVENTAKAVMVWANQKDYK